MQAGYGHSVRLADVEPGSSREAHYVSKYISKSAGARWSVPWRADVINRETGEVTRQVVKARYRTWSASRRWGLTMKQLKAEAAIRARAYERADDTEAAALELLRAALGASPVVTDDSPPAPS